MAEPTAKLAPLDLLEELLPSLPAAIERNDLGEALDSALVAVRNQRQGFEELERLQEAVPYIRKRLGQQDRLIFGATLHGLSDMGNLMAHVNTAKDLDAVRNRVANLPAEVQSLTGIVVRVWSDHISAQLVPTTKLGEVLKEIPKASAVATRVARLKQRVLLLGGQLPGNVGNAEYEQCLKEADHIRTELSALGISDAVASYLRAVAEGSATLDTLTAEVLEWVQSSRLGKRFRIQLI